MFWIKTIKNIQSDKNFITYKIKTLEKRVEIDHEILTAELKAKRTIEQKLKECENWIEALKECANGDRKDINALIQLIKKSTKGKK